MRRVATVARGAGGPDSGGTWTAAGRGGDDIAVRLMGGQSALVHGDLHVGVGLRAGAVANCDLSHGCGCGNRCASTRRGGRGYLCAGRHRRARCRRAAAGRGGDDITVRLMSGQGALVHGDLHVGVGLRTGAVANCNPEARGARRRWG